MSRRQRIREVGSRSGIEEGGRGWLRQGGVGDIGGVKDEAGHSGVEEGSSGGEAARPGVIVV
jgi:hypothetical protein